MQGVLSRGGWLQPPPGCSECTPWPEWGALRKGAGGQAPPAPTAPPSAVLLVRCGDPRSCPPGAFMCCALACVRHPPSCGLGSPGHGPHSVHRWAALRFWERPGFWSPGSAPPNPPDRERGLGWARYPLPPNPACRLWSPWLGALPRSQAGRTAMDGARDVVWRFPGTRALPWASWLPSRCLLISREPASSSSSTEKQGRSASGMRVACEMLFLLGPPCIEVSGGAGDSARAAAATLSSQSQLCCAAVRSEGTGFDSSHDRGMLNTPRVY